MRGQVELLVLCNSREAASFEGQNVAVRLRRIGEVARDLVDTLRPESPSWALDPTDNQIMSIRRLENGGQRGRNSDSFWYRFLLLRRLEVGRYMALKEPRSEVRAERVARGAKGCQWTIAET